MTTTTDTCTITHDTPVYSVNPKIAKYFKENDLPSPALVIDMEVVQQNYHAITRALPFAKCHYAVKANPAEPIMKFLISQGSHFDAASIPEIDLCLRLGAKPEHVLFGNTIKKKSDIADAYAKGVRHYACDSFQELDKLSEAAPGSNIYCRIRTSGAGAAWPLSKKFGCPPEMATELLVKAKTLGLVPYGLSFHVGSQQTLKGAYDEALAICAGIISEVKKSGITLQSIDLGGGFPTQYRRNHPIAPIEEYGKAIKASIDHYFGSDTALKFIMEPGRVISANAGVLQAEVILISYNKEDNHKRWVYLDIGKYSGLAETEAIEYPIVTDKDGEDTSRVVLAGPTCDSTDIIYEKADYQLPLSLDIGDKIYLLNTGAYTTTYASISFNGFSPLKDYYI
jgi:ornithine decarboxylase